MTANVSIKMPDGTWQPNKAPADPAPVLTGLSASAGNLFDALKTKVTKFAYTIDMTGVTSLNFAFNGATSLTEVPHLDTSNVTSMVQTFGGTKVTTVPLYNTTKVTSMANMFQGCTNLTEIPAFDTSSVTTMATMFTSCTSLVTIPWLNTSKVTSLSNTFSGCSKLTSIPALDFSKVTDTTNAFNASNLTSILATGLSVTFAVTNCKLDAAALNVLFSNLATVTSARTITISGNPGAATCNRSIATAKGWTVTG